MALTSERPSPTEFRRQLTQIAHDLNDMLTTIVGNADLILHDMQYSEAVREDVVEVQIAADRAHQIVCRLADCHEGGPIDLFDVPELSA